MGREQDVFELERELAMTRLMTLTGAGGSGKSRLALEVARGLIEAYPEGVWLVELAPLSEEVLVPKAVADALGVPESAGEAIADTLVEVLGDRQLLLILDNCEHLVEATARLVDRLLDSCPGVRILATSREALGVEGEIRWSVPPLSAPQGTPSSEQLEAYESVRLFVERAGGREPSFSLGPHNAACVAVVCRKLEGIPLAVELAAARVGTLSIEQISERLEGSLDLLTHGGRTAMPRHQTLKGTLDWSHELLSEAEKVLFRGLSVFAGGWTLEASEAVGSGEGIAEGEVLDLLYGLTEKSLVVATESEEGGVRYRLLEPVRQYARDKLEESEDAEELRLRHATFFLALADEAEPELWGSQDKEWLERLEGEHDNLRAALSWVLERGEADLGLRLAGALGQFWRARGHDGEGRRWIEEALKKGGGASAMARTKALQLAGWLALSRGDSDRAQAAAEEGLRLSDEAGIGGVVAANLKNTLGEVAARRGDYELATELHEEGLGLCRRAEDRRQVAWALLLLGHASVGRGDLEQAKQLYEEGVALSRGLGGARPLASFLVSLGYEYLLEGDHEQATVLNVEAVEVYREHWQRGGLQFALDNLGWAALMRGDLERAKTLQKECLSLRFNRRGFCDVL